MVLRFLRILLVLITVFVFHDFVLGQSAHIQTPPAAAQPQREAPQASQTSSIAAGEEKALRRYLTRTHYRYFVEFVDRENYLDQTAERIDYKSAIGISDTEEQVMSSIILDASSRVIDDWDQSDALTKKFLQARGAGEKLSDNTEFKTVSENLQTLVDELRDHLKDELGEEFINKLDAYVNREFINRRGPVSLRLIRPKPSVYASKRAQPEAPAIADRRAFELFFELTGAAVERNQEAAAVGKAPQTIPLPRSAPEDKKQEVFAIVLGAHRQLYENALQENAAIGDYHREHGPQPIPFPFPNEFVELGRKHWAIVDENIAKLKQLYGEEMFKRLDEYVNQVFGKELSTTATDPANPQEPR
ncbi:MAG: hypothetical protein ABR990_09435 [Terracidiphilus sp.]